MIRWALPLVAALAAVSVSCSSESESVTLEEWAVVTCETRGALAGLPAPSSLTDLPAFERVTDGFDDAVTSLEAIDPPESASNYHQELLQFYRGISAAQRAFIEAATDGDAATLTAATNEYQVELQRVFDEVDPRLVTTELEQALANAGCPND